MTTEECIWYEDEFCNCGCKYDTEEMKECICSDSDDTERNWDRYNLIPKPTQE